MPKKAGFHLGQSTKILTQARVQELLSYNPETGVFTWKFDMRGGKKAGSIAGCGHGAGYWHIRLDNNLVLAHRMVWLYSFGRLPNGLIDHINGNKRDNRLVNLRECSPMLNAGNSMKRVDNTSGKKGAYFDNYSGRWKAQIAENGKVRHLGRFDTVEEAHAAYCAAADAHFGSFAKAG